ncbi:EF-hand domain-containing protein [Saccharothrix coeruleofusca]|uniref:Calcium-binding protein n=1 Tax=Saccharothrix coeruleofusca TaxID=33919 RepID=A0A918ECT0_9PSEU|nr:EF-hand domain-containing protein [Saccharothrix coeruleofusca]MBP2338053.1 Ca2+-binding EF-hand superfamily protein [Saccharothrix coeruleofusca]GGP51060.1 calcium-binding protein [Saccharothrix coeruleofusca]
MASDLQQRKISVVFAAMDADDDGFLERADFEALTDRWVRLRAADPERLRETMMRWWEVLRESSDHNGDEKVTLAEVLTAVDRLGTMLDLVVATAESMFEAVDEDGDGRITATEYDRMIRAWTGADTPTDGVFGRLDLDGDGAISKSEFAQHWVEFWAGDDPDAPGSSVFGPVG